MRRFLYRIKHRLTRHVVWELSQHIDLRLDEIRAELSARLNAIVLQCNALTDGAACSLAEAQQARHRLQQWRSADNEMLAQHAAEINLRMQECCAGMQSIEQRMIEFRAQIARGFEEMAPLEPHIHRIGETADLIARKVAISGRRVKCLFLINYMQAWDSLADIYQLMRADSDFEVIVATINGRHSEENAHRALVEIGIPHLRLTEESQDTLNAIKQIGPDVIFRQHPWDEELPSALKTESLSFARLCYVPYYGLQVIENFGDGDQSHNLHTDQPFHRACWRIFCEHELVSEVYRKTALLAGHNVVVTGHPKLRRLHHLRGTRPDWPIDVKTAARKYRVIWAPHHSVQYDWMNFGTFALIMKKMLAWADGDSSIEFVLRPHPSLFTFMRSGEVSPDASAEDFENFLCAWNALPNTAVDEKPDYAALFAASDAMITDGISFLTEYQMFDKPLIFIERDDHAKFNKLGELVVQGCISAPDFESAFAAISDLRAGRPDHSAIKRQAVIAQIVPKENPARLIVDEIRGALLPRAERTPPVRAAVYNA